MHIFLNPSLNWSDNIYIPPIDCRSLQFSYIFPFIKKQFPSLAQGRRGHTHGSNRHRRLHLPNTFIGTTRKTGFIPSSYSRSSFWTSCGSSMSSQSFVGTSSAIHLGGMSRTLSQPYFSCRNLELVDTSSAS